VRVPLNRVLRKIFGDTGGESEKKVAQQRNEELHDLCCSLHVIEGTKSRRIRWAGYM
jgi:hypothetical protein